jgi:hypothetical protein
MVAVLPGLAASGDQPVPIEERARGAARIVVATVAETTARHERNEFGDDLIVTYARLTVAEAVKGPSEPVTLLIEGGTVDGITMRVSSLPSLSKGDRAVFFLTPGPNGEFRPHLRGQGILKLDDNDRVRNSSLTLDEIRRLARSGRN